MPVPSIWLFVAGNHQLNFCKMEIRLTLGRKNLLVDFSSRARKCIGYWYVSSVFKEIKPTISLKNISLISILQNSTIKLETADEHAIQGRFLVHRGSVGAFFTAGRQGRPRSSHPHPHRAGEMDCRKRGGGVLEADAGCARARRQPFACRTERAVADFSQVLCPGGCGGLDRGGGGLWPGAFRIVD